MRVHIRTYFVYIYIYMYTYKCVYIHTWATLPCVIPKRGCVEKLDVRIFLQPCKERKTAALQSYPNGRVQSVQPPPTCTSQLGTWPSDIYVLRRQRWPLARLYIVSRLGVQAFSLRALRVCELGFPLVSMTVLHLSRNLQVMICHCTTLGRGRNISATPWHRRLHAVMNEA